MRCSVKRGATLSKLERKNMAPQPETQRRDKRVIARLKRGDAAVDVAAEFGITPSRVYQIKSEAASREAAIREGLLAKVDSDKGRNETILELSACGMPPGQIAQRVGLTPSRVNQIIAAERKNLPIVERNRHIIEAARNGEGQGAIAKRFGIHRSGVNRIINNAERYETAAQARGDWEIEEVQAKIEPAGWIMVPMRLGPILNAAVEIAVAVVALDDAINLRSRADDLAALSKLLNDIDTPDQTDEPALNQAAQRSRRAGGMARAKALTAKRRKEIAEGAAAAQWGAAKDTADISPGVSTSLPETP